MFPNPFQRQRRRRDEEVLHYNELGHRRLEAAQSSPHGHEPMDDGYRRRQRANQVSAPYQHEPLDDEYSRDKERGGSHALRHEPLDDEHRQRRPRHSTPLRHDPMEDDWRTREQKHRYGPPPGGQYNPYFEPHSRAPSMPPTPMPVPQHLRADDVSMPSQHEPLDTPQNVRRPKPTSAAQFSEPMHDEVTRQYDRQQQIAKMRQESEEMQLNIQKEADKRASRMPVQQMPPALPVRKVEPPTIEVKEVKSDDASAKDKPEIGSPRDVFAHSRKVSNASNLPTPDPTLRVWSPRSSLIPGSSSPPLSVSDRRSRYSLATSVALLGEKCYMYSPLGENEIRLVKILPARKFAVQCEIVHADLDNPPEYQALSYAWGDASDTKNIQIEGFKIPITASLYGALVALRMKAEPVLLWADALSINQQDREERTEQVKLMTKIYGNASLVAVWLGAESDNSSMALNFLREISHASEDSQGAVEKVMRTPENSKAIPATVALFERDYWQRLWVVQEVLQANYAVVYCGTSRLSWSKCSMSRDIFTRHRSEIDRQFPAGVGRSIESQNQLSYSQVLIHHGPGSIPALSQRSSLLQILRACRKKLSFDPRDKVFGLLGIMPEIVQQDFRVDYELSVKEVYTDVVDILLTVTDRLDVICESVHFPLHTSAHRLPSWVPDWSHVPQVTALGLSFDFNASRDTKVEFTFDGESRNRLEIKAIHLDYVASHGVSVGTFCTTADFLMAFLHWRAILLGSDLLGPEVKDPNRRKEVHDAFCRTLCLAQVPEQWEKNWTEVVYHIFSKMLHARLPYLPLDSKLAEHINWNLGVPETQHRGLMHQHIGARMRGRTFCMTKQSRLGMGTGFMAPGDEIIVPFGCRTPIIVRREGSRGEYRLVGDVYIDRFMDGRAIDHWKADKLPSKKYILH